MGAEGPPSGRPGRSGRVAALVGLLALLLPAACRPGRFQERRYALQGRVLSVEPSSARVRVAHEDIPGFMPGMTMDFSVRDAPGLARLAPGDVLRATLVIGADNQTWLEGLQVTGHVPPSPVAPMPGSAEGRPGDRAPDVELRNQDGRAIRLRDYEGRALAVTFIFTRCPLPEFCPLIASRFAELARALGADPGLAGRAHLLAVSFDTAYDTPAVLRAYGLRFQPPGRPPFQEWELASGEAAAVRRLAEFAGLDYVEEERSFTHNLRTAVIGADGRLRRVWHGNDWTAEELLLALRGAAEPAGRS